MMISIDKQLVTNEAMEPVAVIIPYDDWQKIEAILKQLPAFSEFAGAIAPQPLADDTQEPERGQQNGNEPATKLFQAIADCLKELSIADRERVLQFVEELASEARQRAMPPEVRRERLAALMQQMADRGTAFADVDPVEWQQEQRKDRPGMRLSLRRRSRGT